MEDVRDGRTYGAEDFMAKVQQRWPRKKFRVSFTQSAWNDLEEIVAYWTSRDQPERGEQYAHDLPSEAIRQLSDPRTARAVAQKPCWPRGFF